MSNNLPQQANLPENLTEDLASLTDYLGKAVEGLCLIPSNAPDKIKDSPNKLVYWQMCIDRISPRRCEEYAKVVLKEDIGRYCFSELGKLVPENITTCIDWTESLQNGARVRPDTLQAMYSLLHLKGEFMTRAVEECRKQVKILGFAGAVFFINIAREAIKDYEETLQKVINMEVALGIRKYGGQAPSDDRIPVTQAEVHRLQEQNSRMTADEKKILLRAIEELKGLGNGTTKTIEITEAEVVTPDGTDGNANPVAS